MNEIESSLPTQEPDMSKLCKECQHIGVLGHTRVCDRLRTYVLDPVNGSYKQVDNPRVCDIERSSNNPQCCGPEAKFFIKEERLCEDCRFHELRNSEHYCTYRRDSCESQRGYDSTIVVTTKRKWFRETMTAENCCGKHGYDFVRKRNKPDEKETDNG